MISPTVLSIPDSTQDNLHSTHDIPHGTEHPHGTQDIPHGTHDIPHGTEHPMVLSTHHGTAHILYRVITIAVQFFWSNTALDGPRINQSDWEFRPRFTVIRANSFIITQFGLL